MRQKRRTLRPTFYPLHVPRDHQVAPVYAHKVQNNKQQILHLGKVHVGKVHLGEVHVGEVHLSEVHV